MNVPTIALHLFIPNFIWVYFAAVLNASFILLNIFTAEHCFPRFPPGSQLYVRLGEKIPHL
jgi:hypothetical protein